MLDPITEMGFRLFEIKHENEVDYHATNQMTTDYRGHSWEFQFLMKRFGEDCPATTSVTMDELAKQKAIIELPDTIHKY